MLGPQYNKSQFFGYDAVHGWGNTTYFSYFSEFNRPWQGLPYIEAFSLCVLFLLSLFGNILIFYQIMHIKSTRTVTNFLICNLAIADILFSLGGPFVAVSRVSGTWILGSFMCKLLVYTMFICSSVMIWTMTVVSIDRYICINKVKSQKISPRSAILIILLIWIIDFASFIPFALFFNVHEFPFGSSSVKICTLMWPNFSTFRFSVFYTTFLCIIGYVVPLIVIITNYSRILKKFWSSRRAVMNIPGNTQRQMSKASTRRLARDTRDFKVVKTLVLIVVLFVIMWTPIFSVFVAIQLDGMAENMEVSSQALIVTLCIALCNACANPFIYGIMNTKIKNAITSCLCKKKRGILSDEARNSATVPISAISYHSHNSSNS